MRVRVRVVYSERLGWHVALPTYTMVPHSWKPVIPNKSHQDGVLPQTDPADPALRDLTCEVEVPDSYVDPETGKLDEKSIRKLYKGHKLWDRDGVVDDVQR